MGRSAAYPEAQRNKWFAARFDSVRKSRLESTRPATQRIAQVDYRFGEVRQRGDETVIGVPAISSENCEHCRSICTQRAQLLRTETTTSNAEVRAVHLRAMPVILTEPAEWDLASAPWSEAKALQRPLPDGVLLIVLRGEKEDTVERASL